MATPDLQKIEEIVRDLPVFDTVIQKVLGLINNETTTAVQLENLIKEDAVLSLKIIKLANSSFFSPVKPITSIAHAVRYIGFSTLKSLVYSIALQSLGGKGKKIQPELKYLHNKLVVNAIITLMIGKNYLKNNNFIFSPDDFYVFGLFHDIGLLAIASYDTENLYLPMLHKVESGSSLADVETSFPHYLVGSRLMEKWQVPEIFREFTASHHQELLNDHKLFVPFQIIRLAEFFSYKLGYDVFAPKDLDVEAVMLSININPADFFDEGSQLTPVKLFVDNLLSGFAV